jgi:hypothetical protein
VLCERCSAIHLTCRKCPTQGLCTRRTRRIRRLVPEQWLRRWPLLPSAELALDHRCASALLASSPFGAYGSGGVPWSPRQGDAGAAPVRHSGHPKSEAWEPVSTTEKWPSLMKTRVNRQSLIPRIIVIPIEYLLLVKGSHVNP